MSSYVNDDYFRNDIQARLNNEFFAPQVPFRFMDLLAELRLHIAEYTLSHRSVLQWQWTTHSRCEEGRPLAHPWRLGVDRCIDSVGPSTGSKTEYEGHCRLSNLWSAAPSTLFMKSGILTCSGHLASTILHLLFHDTCIYAHRAP